MRVRCSNCKKILNIPDERLPMGEKISFPCPSCKGIIEMDLRQKASGDEPSSADDRKEYLKGDALKKKILSSVKDLPPHAPDGIEGQGDYCGPQVGFQGSCRPF